MKRLPGEVLLKDVNALAALIPTICEDYDNQMSMKDAELDKDCWIMLTLVNKAGQYDYIFTWYCEGDVPEEQGDYIVNEDYDNRKDLYYFPLTNISMDIQLTVRVVEFANKLHLGE